MSNASKEDGFSTRTWNCCTGTGQESKETMDRTRREKKARRKVLRYRLGTHWPLPKGGFFKDFKKFF
jgi:hypothetical protein